MRNFDGIQFEELRKVIDHKYNTVHDELSDAYYGKKPFRNYGLLTKEQFDTLHGLIFLIRDVEFHEENLKQVTPYLESKYNEMTDDAGRIIKKSAFAKSMIQDLKTQGYELVI